MIATYTSTQLIAAFMGLYCIAAGIGLLTQRDFYKKMMRKMRDDETLGFVTGFLVFVVGALLVSIHNSWGTILEVVVSILGWGALVEGLLILAVRRPFIGFFARLPFTDSIVKGLAVIAILLGGVLVSCGLA